MNYRSFAKLTAIRLASSFVSNFAADCRYCRHTPLKVWQYHPDRQS
jgi:hypothetical protein